MMRAAVINERGAVTNIIIADPDKDTLPGVTLVAAPDGMAVDTRWVWSEAEGFKPSPELQVELDARAAAEAEYQAGLTYDFEFV